jgi:hypothetical protein
VRWLLTRKCHARACRAEEQARQDEQRRLKVEAEKQRAAEAAERKRQQEAAARARAERQAREAAAAAERHRQQELRKAAEAEQRRREKEAAAQQAFRALPSSKQFEVCRDHARPVSGCLSCCPQIVSTTLLLLLLLPSMLGHRHLACWLTVFLLAALCVRPLLQVLRNAAGYGNLPDVRMIWQLLSPLARDEAAGVMRAAVSGCQARVVALLRQAWSPKQHGDWHAIQDIDHFG